MNNQVSDTDSGLFTFRYIKTKYNQQIEALVIELKKNNSQEQTQMWLISFVIKSACHVNK